MEVLLNLRENCIIDLLELGDLTNFYQTEDFFEILDPVPFDQILVKKPTIIDSLYI